MMTISTVVVATANAGKAREFGRLLGSAFSVEPVPSGVCLPEETGATFAENARIKALSVFQDLRREATVLADDSGLEVEALGGRPGVMSARFAGSGATDDDNVRKLLAELAGCTDRRARFVCCLCLVLGDGSMVEVEGISRGTITEAPRGDDGFGYDPVFVPEGWALTLAEARPEEKDGISHRGAAVRALLSVLETKGFVIRGL
jgi:XTP/dITP diphosphohydrolase